MKVLSLFIALIALSFFSCNSSSRSDDTNSDQQEEKEHPEAKLVRQSFKNYRSAILNDQAKEAIKYVDSRTLQYYSDILEEAKIADSLEVDAMGILDKLMVFSIRNSIPKEDLLSFDGKQLFEYAIRNGMVGKNTVANVAIGEVTIDNAFAKGQFINNGQKTPLSFHFYREDMKWKIDLTATFQSSSIGFKELQENSGMSENDYLIYILEMTSGEKPGNEIWKTIQ